MEFKIEDLALTLKANVVRKVGPEEMIIKIGDKEHVLQILYSGTNQIEFMLDNSYHHAKYIDINSTDMQLEVDGNPVTVSQFAELRAITSKSSKHSSNVIQKVLMSFIPGRVVSVVAKPGMEVKKGDVIAILESMKMQVAIKAHKDGKVKELNVKEGSSISRNHKVALIE